MNRGIGALGLAELADVPDRKVERFIQLGGGNLGILDAGLQREQALGDLRGDVSVMHGVWGVEVRSGDPPTSCLQTCTGGDSACEYPKIVQAGSLQLNRDGDGMLALVSGEPRS